MPVRAREGRWDAGEVQTLLWPIAMPRTDATSLACLPALIYEIDSRQRRPTKANRAEMIARYRQLEYDMRVQKRGHNLYAERVVACWLVNEYLVDVVWRTRKYRM